MRWSRLREALFAPVDIAWLVYLRLAFAGLMLWHVATYLGYGRVRRYWIEPEFHFTFAGFEWVEPWAGDGMILHFQVLGALAFLIGIGFAYRLSAALFFVGFTYVFLLERARYQNHTYFICLLSFLMIWLPAHRALSVDARLRPWLRSRHVPAWTLWLVRFQVGVPYFFGGVAKINGDWLRGEPLREWLPRVPDFPVFGPHFGEDWAVYLFSYGGLALDLLAVPLLLWRRTRLVMFAVLVVFHCSNAKLFTIGVFPWMMILLTPVFFAPSWPRRLLRLRAPTPPDLPEPTRPRVVLAALTAWGLVQVLLPLRHFAIPGRVSWTKEGQLFSWHMKLNDTDGQVVFEVTDPATGAGKRVDPRGILTPWQVARMDGRPEMIRQFACYLAAQEQRAGRPGAEVRATAKVSLNNRPFQLLIDPQVDLARAEPAGLFGHAPWIVRLVVGGR